MLGFQQSQKCQSTQYLKSVQIRMQVLLHLSQAQVYQIHIRQFFQIAGGVIMKHPVMRRSYGSIHAAQRVWDFKSLKILVVDMIT